MIRIVVVDAATQKPVNLARVLLDGPVITSEFTGNDGRSAFTEVPDGIYRARIFKNGYQSATTTSFEIVSGNSVTISVTLAQSTQLKTIAIVSARSTATVSATSITNDSPQRKLSTDLADALNKLSGVSVATASDDSDASQTISLEGHDASQTQLSLDGIPLNAPGAAGDLRSFATDLFSGASVRNGPQAGGLGGGVNFSTVEPTLSWTGSTTIGVASNGKSNDAFSESGSFGKVGIALMHTDRTNTSLLDGMRFLDASGLDYSHDGDAYFGGNLAKLRWNAGDAQTLNFMYLGSVRNIALSCTRLVNSIPCGFGPNNFATGNVSLMSLSDDALLGSTAVRGSLFRNASTNDRDLLDRFVNGVAQPSGFNVNSASTGYSLSAELPARERHTISLQLSGTSTSVDTLPLVAQSVPFANGPQHSGYGTFQIVDTMHSNAKLSLTDTLGGSIATNSSAGLLGSVGIGWRPTSHDAYSASYSIGGVAAQFPRAQILSDPQSLTFDCNANVAFGNAPGDQATATSSTSARAGYSRSWTGGNVSLSLYRQTQNGVLLPVEVNATLLGGALPVGYLASVQQLYNSPAGCNGAQPFGLQNLYFNEQIAGVRRIYQGGSISGFFSLGNLIAQPYINVNSTSIASSDPRIDNPFSFELPNAQVPNVPLHRAGVTVDYKAPRSSVEYLFDAQYVGANNPNNLPAYTTYDGAISTLFARGALTFSVNNLSNRFAGIFASPQNQVPYQTANGTLIANIARPLAPRSYNVSYTVRFGAGAAALSAPSLLAQNRRGGGGPRNAPLPLPSTPPADPLALVASARCDANASGKAKPVLDGLKAYVAQIEAAKTGTGYPESMAAPQIGGIAVSYHKMGDSYALSIVPSDFTILRSLFPCVALHRATEDDVKARNLYEPKQAAFFRLEVAFMPSVGLYIVPRPPQAGQEQFRIYALPSSPPAAPFALHAGAACDADMHASAQTALAELQAYFASPGAAVPSWTITAHAGKAGTWYELAPRDPSTLGAVLSCGRVAAAAAADLQQRGFDGAAPPSLNYTPSLGLYILRRMPPAGAPARGQ